MLKYSDWYPKFKAFGAEEFGVFLRMGPSIFLIKLQNSLPPPPPGTSFLIPKPQQTYTHSVAIMIIP